MSKRRTLELSEGMTGTVIATILTAAPTGWLMFNGDTLGSASSAATRASADFKALFLALWNSLTNTDAPVSGGRGASATADWTANKTITLPDMRGRSIIGTGTGTGLTARTHGALHRSRGAYAHRVTNAAARPSIPSFLHYHRLGRRIDANDGWFSNQNHKRRNAGRVYRHARKHSRPADWRHRRRHRSQQHAAINGAQLDRQSLTGTNRTRHSKPTF